MNVGASKGLPVGATVAIAVVVAAICLVILIALIWITMKKKKGKNPFSKHGKARGNGSTIDPDFQFSRPDKF